jgi:uncharacterized lipoprotein YbaY
MLAMAALVVSCTTNLQSVPAVGRNEGFGIISGTILYPNDLYFPAKIRLETTLYAMAGPSGPERILVSQTIRNPQRFPVNFTLRYDRAEVVPSETHLIAVRLYREGSDTPFLINGKRYQVRLPAGADGLKIELAAPPKQEPAQIVP